ncbi:MAG: tRNA pseudouridine(38-40) synthase TruA [Aeromonadales bacterium]|nr:tRNA pseudouridine(38-40) synthase TruA [Aeromonadales bacterium]MDY2890996.1 tRNA pseudouridine(38-40) synthase TruA [Succinivibrio sp.]
MRIAMCVEYEGWGYSGFQRQKECRSVQGELERALSAIADESVVLSCAGRTDAGVSATGQVIHFDCSKERSDRSWVMGTNTHLPRDIAVSWARHVDDSFHARFSARARRYRYIIRNTVSRPGVLSRGVSVYHGEYDAAAMDRAAQCLCGEHDFSSFCGADEESRSRSRYVHYASVNRSGPFMVFDIAANAFLNHMVRNIVGSLLEVGEGKKPEGWLKEALEARDREAAGPTARPDGLYLVDVTYPSSFGLPRRDFIGPLWLE